MSKMHENEVPTSLALVRDLLARQFPHWAELPIVAEPSAGTDNALFRLGGDMVVRLPRIDWAVGQVLKEQKWLPWLAPQLPVAIPTPLGLGDPSADYPYHWSIYRWLPGKNGYESDVADMNQLAEALAGFITALQGIDGDQGPRPGIDTNRGVPLVERDDDSRRCIQQLAHAYNAASLLQAWEHCLNADPWREAPVWLHGDLQPGNFLLRDGQLSAIIDFGCLVVGDPACDLMIAWNYLTGEARDCFRNAVAVDDATWIRGQGWALSMALMALPYYWETNPILANLSRFIIREVLADLGLPA